MKEGASFSEESSKAIMDLLIRTSSQVSVMQEQVNLLLAIVAHQQNNTSQVDVGSAARYEHYSQGLRDLLFAHYGEIDIQHLLKPL